jgi:hypothetical protein
MTFWQDSDTGGTKNNNVVVSSPQGGSYELLVASERPSKRRNVSPVSPVFYEAATPSPVKKRASAPPAKEPKSKATDELQCFCDELEVRLKISSDDLAEAEKETEQAVGDRRRLQQQYENAQQMCTDQLLLHQQLVSELKLRLQDVDDLRKADATYIESLEADANREHLPVPQNVTEIPFCLEYITDCASNKGAHLPSRVKLLCESVWSDSVYNGQCSTYLLDKATGVIQSENPYHRAIEIAKVIDLSGSILNLSGYDTLRRGMEADENGRIKRMGGLLTSKYQVKKAMKNVEQHAQEVIPFDVVDVDGIDGFKFNYEPLLMYLLQLFQLEDAARDINQPNFHYVGWC